MKTISFSLKSSEIDNAIREIKNYQKNIKFKVDEFAKRLVLEGVSIAHMKLLEKNAVYTGELMSSVTFQKEKATTNGVTYIVYTNCPWAKYVEFGTGIVGKTSPHPKPQIVNWKYDVNDHGELGWFYYKDGKWHWTKGMESRPFMYETGWEMRNKIATIAKEVFDF